MNKLIALKDIQSKIVEIRNQKVIIDRDVAALYGVETKRINEAVKNNPERFPEGYIFELTDNEKFELVENFDQFNVLKHSKVNPKAYTEKGLYMLATILKSNVAINTSISIIETFAKIKELNQALNALSTSKDQNKQKSLMQRSGEIFSEILDNDVELNETETTIEINFAVLKFKHTI